MAVAGCVAGHSSGDGRALRVLPGRRSTGSKLCFRKFISQARGGDSRALRTRRRLLPGVIRERKISRARL